MISQVNAVVAALRAAGIRADRGNGQALQPTIQSAVAAVSVAHADEQEQKLKVCILAPAEQGGRVCEELAQTTASLLRQQNASCTVGPCQFDGEMGLFVVEILAAWQLFLESQVFVDQQKLPYVTELSAAQTRQMEAFTNGETGESTVVRKAKGWEVTIQELLPVGATAAVEPMEAFTLKVMRKGWVETYPDCYWSSILLQDTQTGILRRRTAVSWSERTVQA